MTAFNVLLLIVLCIWIIVMYNKYSPKIDIAYFYMRIAKIEEIGIGVRFWVSKSQDGKHLIDPYYTTYSEYKWSNNKELPDYVFLTKEEKISD